MDAVNPMDAHRGFLCFAHSLFQAVPPCAEDRKGAGATYDPVYCLSGSEPL
jgi:hypothetical protein